MRPNEEADDCDGNARTSDEGVAEDGLAREGRNDFADHTHGGKNHDVYGRVRIEPEQMLEEDGIAAESGIEKAQMKHALEAGEQQGDGDNGSAENHDQASGVVSPREQREAEPGHPGGAHGVDGDDEVKAGEDGREAVDKDADDGGCDRGIRINAAERRVKGPAGVQTAGAEGIKNKNAANDIDVPAEKIDFRKGQILRADHHGNQEIAQDRGD